MSTTYIHFTAEQKERARQTDLASLLSGQGETLKRSGSEYVWRDGSEKVTIRGNLWYHQYDQEGGDAIDFVKRFMEKSYPEAVEYLLGGRGGSIISALPFEKQKKAAEFELPERNKTMRRAYAYLNIRRGIDKDVLNVFIGKKMIYESLKYHNVVFVGYDKTGTPKHANMRGTGSNSTYKGNAEGSTPEYSFHWHGADEKLYLFEAPVDMLSFISMNKRNWQVHSYAACCGVGDRVLFRMLEDNPNIKIVCLCLDNDKWGDRANRRIADKLYLKELQTEILVPSRKDWNEDLVYLKENPKAEEETMCRELQLS